MGSLRNYRDLSEGEKFREKYSFEEAIDKINSFELGGYDTRRDLAQLINGFITGYKAEIEQDNDLAQKLANVINNECRYEFFFDWIHNGSISYEPMAANVANLLVDELQKDARWPDDVDYRMPNKRLFASIDGKEQIDVVKQYVSAQPSPNSVYLSYAAFSNPNFGEEYRNALFTQTMGKVHYVGAYFTNATPEMEAFCQQRLKDILTGERYHNSLSTELSYLQKAIPNILTPNNLKELMSTMSETEKCNMLIAVDRDYLIGSNNIEALKLIIKEVEETQLYKDAADPLNDAPTTEEKELLDAMEGVKDVVDFKEAMMARHSQREGKEDIDEVL